MAKFSNYEILREHLSQKAIEFKCDADRVVAWKIFSNLFLDTDFSDEELNEFAEILAKLPFSIAELSHILGREVGPACEQNLMQWPGGEWLAFSDDTLIPKCIKNQEKNPFQTTKDQDSIPLLTKLMAPFHSNPYKLYKKIQEIRAIS